MFLDNNRDVLFIYDYLNTYRGQPVATEEAMLPVNVVHMICRYNYFDFKLLLACFWRGSHRCKRYRDYSATNIMRSLKEMST
jgi:hypothetical protein